MEMRRILGPLVLSAALAAFAVPAVAQAGPFQSPSGNIGCYIAKSGVRCDIRERSWKPPPKPGYCELDRGQGAEPGPGPSIRPFRLQGPLPLRQLVQRHALREPP